MGSVKKLLIKRKYENKTMAKLKVIEQLKDDPLMPLRHSAEHILHTAMQELYPETKKVMGPPIKDGFYFDFDLDTQVSVEDFPKIEAKMQEIIDAKLDLKMTEIDEARGKEIFKENPYKLTNLEEIIARGEKITVCEIGTEKDTHHDLDLCAGPHIANTSDIKAFKLLSVAGAYYKGDEKNKMLQRIYATAFTSKKDLDEYLAKLEEAKKRDHRKLGQELELFTFSEDVGLGLPLWLPKGNIVREELEKWAKETERKWGYVRVSTPHIGKSKLYETSGHIPYYKDDMYNAIDIDGEEYYLKAMNCPHHHMIFKSHQRSYKELPLRVAEYGMCYRYEQSGSLFGLMRVRGLQQNDAHIYCTLEQAEEEFLTVLKLHEYYYNALGLTKNDYYLVVGLPSEEKKDKYHGDKTVWDMAEKIMRNAIAKSDIQAKDDIGGAAFYGPKIDFNVVSSIGREFSISTNQLDLFMPERFKLEYIDSEGKVQRPAVIHRAPLGSHERFIGFLIEHFGGNFPVWLAPVQVEIIPIADRHVEFGKKLQEKLFDMGLRVEINDRGDSFGAKIRNAQLQKIPYMMVVGDREIANNQVSLRLRDGKDLGAVDIELVATEIKRLYENRSLNLWEKSQ
ncbi:threonine--tRNA ligase [candidate division WWE3 bacterium]|nr:threonine--tRNA ligase [candidate division WWE3 bacterium]